MWTVGLKCERGDIKCCAFVSQTCPPPPPHPPLPCKCKMIYPCKYNKVICVLTLQIHDEQYTWVLLQNIFSLFIRI